MIYRLTKILFGISGNPNKTELFKVIGLEMENKMTKELIKDDQIDIRNLLSKSVVKLRLNIVFGSYSNRY